MKSPNHPHLIQQAQRALREEASKRQEFYDWPKEDVKAEFINGHIVMHSPVKERHWTAMGNIYSLLSSFVIKNKLGRVASEKALIALKRNDYDRTADAAGRLFLEAGESRPVHSRSDEISRAGSGR